MLQSTPQNIQASEGVEMAEQVPNIVVGRLPVYLRALRHLDNKGQTITSSKEMASILGTSAAQIRKDLSHFGEFGKQGTGYHIPYLMEQLERILHIDEVWDVVLAGAGDLGHALLHNKGIVRRGFRIVAAFDNDPEKIGSRVADVIIQDADRMISDIQARGLRIAIIAVPTPAAQEVIDELVAAGVKGILNYSPIAVTVPDDVMVQYVDPVAFLQQMTYYLEH
jgi:redox-sensing transcriptional repressor